MQVTFWGVRGSTPTPQSENMRYGGNTACVEVRFQERLYVFDCGTGFRNLGKQLSREFNGRPLQAHIFISHFHWDHIQGIPFFSPLYDAENRFLFHSLNRTRQLRDAIEGQMVQPYFPVNMSEMAARREFYELSAGGDVFDDCLVKTCWLNHPQGCLGFRMETSAGILVYATDNEPGDPVFDGAVRKLAEGANLLIYDAQYLPEEYEARKRGWGHSHWREAVKIAQESGVKDLVLFHHDPDHSDACLDRVAREARELYSQLQVAAEGMVLHL
jgi:phosphoribosyl 1,2-cyclic phosphodiesterase